MAGSKASIKDMSVSGSPLKTAIISCFILFAYFAFTQVVMMDKQRKKVAVTDLAILGVTTRRKKEHEKLETYQGLKGELEKLCKVKATVVHVVNRAVTPQAGRVVPADAKNNILVIGTAKTLH